MSSDQGLFRAPSAYPEPPQGMYYEVPKTPPAGERPKPIFPWESNAPPPTRVFADDRPPSPEPSTASTPGETDDDTQADVASPTTPTFRVSSPDPWETYTRSNAWDDIPEIERYMSNLQISRKAKVQVLHNIAAASEGVLSPGADDESGSGDRRHSMKLTDFPTEIERPSLPVTPAPIRRPSFWGEARDAQGELPAAEGVPKQEEWDPTAKLEELSRRQSDVLPKILNTGVSRDIPDRELPKSSAHIPTSPPIVPGVSPSGGSSSRGTQPSGPQFTEPGFESGATSTGKPGEREGPLSPSAV